MFESLITYEDLLEAEPELFGFGVVTFKKDFGPWKKGHRAPSLWFTTKYDDAHVDEIDDEGSVLKTCKFELTAIV